MFHIAFGVRILQIWTKILPKMLYKTFPIFQYAFNHQNLPKWDQKGPQKALSELGKSTWGPFWAHQAGLFVSKTALRPLKKVILTSYGGQWTPIAATWNPFSPSASCSANIAMTIFVGKALMHKFIPRIIVRSLLIGARPCTHLHRSSFNSRGHRVPLTLQFCCTSI